MKLKNTCLRRDVLFGLAGLTSTALLGTLSGCAMPVKAPTTATPQAGHGTVLVRITSVGLKKMYAFVVKARPVGSREQIFLSGWGTQSEGYWTVVGDHLEKGQLVALEIAAGDYEMFSFQATSQTLAGPKTSTPTENFSYPFKVISGEVVYLGELYFKFDDKTNAATGSPGQNVPLKISVQENRARDFRDALKKVPGLKPDQITVRLLRRSSTDASPKG